LLTNDGDLAQQLTHPKYGVPKTYYVVVAGQIEPDEMKRLRRGIYLSDGVARVDFVKIKKFRKGSTELEITLSEGKNREIRRVLARLGHKVVTLRRLSIGPLKLGAMPVGAYRPLTKDEVLSLYRAADEAKKARRQRKETNEERDVEREQRLAAREAKRALAGEPVESTAEVKPSATRTNASKLGDAKAAGSRSRQPMKEVVDRTPARKKARDPFDWDDDELLLASPFAANHPPAGSDEADDDDDGWVTPLMAGMNEDDDDDMPGMSFHQSSVESDAVLLRDGGSERSGGVIDYDDDDFEDGDAADERPARPARGRSTKKSPKQPAKRASTRTDSRSSSGSGERSSAVRKKGSKKFSPRNFASKGSKGASRDSVAGGRTSATGKKSSSSPSSNAGRDRTERKSFKKSSPKRSSAKSSATKKGGPRSGATTKRSSFKKSAGKSSGKGLGKRSKRSKR
jgi:pseudouridine synthase